MTAALRPYVPRLVIDWLAEERAAAHRCVDGTLVFADISGFTALTEKLARNGKAGAEEMGDILNRTFEQLLDAAYAYGAGLLKWGGDAALLLFTGEGHARRATRACVRMQQTIRSVGQIRSSCGNVALRMSVGVHSGAIDMFLVGTHHRELIVTGPAVTTVARMEADADAGEIALSAQTAALLPGSAVVVDDRGRVLLRRAPAADTETTPPSSSRADALLRDALPRSLVDHVGAGIVDPEHRHVATVFVAFTGVDHLLEVSGPTTTATALTSVIDAADEVAEEYGVCFLASDINKDGGKLILVAGAPTTTGDVEQRALCAARALVDRAGALNLSAGVTRGRVFSGDFGPSYRRTYSIVADSVNLSARLMAKAAPGQVVATRDVVGASNADFPTTDLNAFHVKGKSDPIDAVTVDALPDASGAEPVSAGSDFAGRETDLVALWAAWDSVVAGSGQVLEIVGEAGIGKSRLLAEWHAAAQPPTIAAGCDVYAANRPYWPISRLVRSAVGAKRLGADNGLTWLQAALAEARPELTPYVSLAAPVFGFEAAYSEATADLSEAFRLRRMTEVIVAALDAALDGPTTLIVGDLHYADQATVEVLRLMTATVPAKRWLLIVTRRPDGPSLVESDAPYAAMLWLSPLSDEAALSLLERLTDTAPRSTQELREMLSLAGGNPLYLRELAAWEAADGELPDSVESAVASRIDRLPPTRRRALRAVSVLGVQSEQSVALDVLTADGLEADERLWRALGDFIDSTAGRIRFRQSMVRDVAYAGLPFSRRKRLHAAAADSLRHHTGDFGSIDGVLSFHLAEAGRHAEAFELALAAGAHARAAYAQVDAVVFYERALTAAQKLAPLRAEIPSTAEALGRCLNIVARPERAREVFALQRRAAQTAVQRAAAASWLAVTDGRLGRYQSQLRWVRRGLDDLDSAEPEPDAAEVIARMCTCAASATIVLGRFGAAVEWATRGIEAAAAAGLVSPEVAELRRLRASARILGGAADPEADSSDLMTALAVLEGQAQPLMRARVLNDLGMQAYFRGEWDVAAEHYSNAERDLTAAGDEWMATLVAINLAELRIDQGRWDEAAGRLRAMLRVLRAAHTPREVAHANKFLAIALARSGNATGAMPLFDTAESLLRQGQEEGSLEELTVRVAEAHVLDGNGAAALARVDAALADGDGASPWVPALLRTKGLALAQLGRREESVATLVQALGAARGCAARHEVAFTLDALGLVQPLTAVEQCERDELVARLGIVTFPRVPLPTATPRPRKAAVSSVR